MAPAPLPAGRYSASEGLATADQALECPLGHYCPEGVAQPYACPAGRFGASKSLTAATCSLDATATVCPKGFVCPVSLFMTF